jgi:RNA polymerase sigma-70 factor (ECF subfamily)
MQKLCELHRRNFGVKARDVSREVYLYNGPSAHASSAILAAQLIGKLTTPTQAAVRAERKSRLEEALNSMEVIDREVLALRHFEQLTNAETARVLGITESAASNRYVRAAKRLKRLLDQF